MYLTHQVTTRHRTADVIVMDVLPTSLPLLLARLPSAGVLFYCHFPDKLLLRGNASGRPGSVAKRWYRTLLDAMEESTMGLADTLVVNSRFTLGQVREHFPSLDPTLREQQQQQQQQQQQPRRRPPRPIEVLYPALDTSNMAPHDANDQHKTSRSPIVSLNRFERKKNIGLLIEAYACMMKRDEQEDGNGMASAASRGGSPSQPLLPPLIIAGGYDTQNVENVEYRGELGALAERLGVRTNVTFMTDVSDAERSSLLRSALCVVYTPDREHFGIVPLEAMYSRTPVLAVNSGGPVETIRDGVTGFLREPTPSAFAGALRKWIEDPKLATTMGEAGREHVESTFGPERFEREWQVLVEETVRRGRSRHGMEEGPRPRRRQPELVWWMNAGWYMAEACVVLALLLAMTLLLRWMGVLEKDQYIPSALRTILAGDEL
jgi:alpha-1,3/alpha-1,6-mannosyltransferase